MHLNKAIEVDPSNINALFSRGACYNRLGNYEKALEDYYVAIEKDTISMQRKPIIRNFQKELGLIAQVKGGEDKQQNDSRIQNSGNQSFVNSNSENLDDINNYIYSQLNERRLISKQLYDDLITKSPRMKNKSNIDLLVNQPVQPQQESRANDEYSIQIRENLNKLLVERGILANRHKIHQFTIPEEDEEFLNQDLSVYTNQKNTAERNPNQSKTLGKAINIKSNIPELSKGSRGLPTLSASKHNPNKSLNNNNMEQYSIDEGSSEVGKGEKNSEKTSKNSKIASQNSLSASKKEEGQPQRYFNSFINKNLNSGNQKPQQAQAASGNQRLSISESSSPNILPSGYFNSASKPIGMNSGQTGVQVQKDGSPTKLLNKYKNLNLDSANNKAENTKDKNSTGNFVKYSGQQTPDSDTVIRPKQHINSTKDINKISIIPEEEQQTAQIQETKPKRGSESDPWENLHAKGYAARKKENYNQAVELYSKALELKPDYFKALFNRGFAYDKLGEYDMAIKDYQRAISVEPQNAYAYYNIAISLDKKGDYQSTIENFTKAISILPDKHDFYLNRALTYRKIKDFDSAIKDYTDAVNLDNRSYKGFYNRGLCYEKKEDYQNALKDFTKTLEFEEENLNKSNAQNMSSYLNILLHLGNINEKIKENEQAMNYFEKILSFDSNFAAAYHGIGLVLDKYSKFQEAIKYFDKAIMLEPGNSIYWHNRGCSYRNLGDIVHSIEDMNKAIELDPENPLFYDNRSYLWKLKEDFDRAIKDYSSIIRLDPYNIKALVNRAFCFAKKEDYNRAAQDYSMILDIEPKHTHALYNRAISCDKQGQLEEAISDFTKIIEIEPMNANAYLNRGCCFEK